MKLSLRLLIAVLTLLPALVFAQTPAPTSLPPAPTTKIIAIGTLTGQRTPEMMKLLATKEVPDTVRLFLAGKIDQWYSLQDGSGVVFILNMSSVEEARTALEALPLGKAKLMTFQLIPVGPLRPLGLLLPEK